jgi:hypothetical protein
MLVVAANTLISMRLEYGTGELERDLLPTLNDRKVLRRCPFNFAELKTHDPKD